VVRQPPFTPRGTGSVTAEDRLGGVRPSSGAAMSERERAPMESDASEQPVLAAPEDGRTPPPATPAFTEGLPRVRVSWSVCLNERNGQDDSLKPSMSNYSYVAVDSGGAETRGRSKYRIKARPCRESRRW